MLSEKVALILKTKGFTDGQLEGLSESEAWDHVYRMQPPKKEKLPEVCFTGFTDDEAAELALIAAQAHLRVVTKVTVGLRYLCTGPVPGPSKLAQAQKQAVPVLNRPQFEHLLRTGELPR